MKKIYLIILFLISVSKTYSQEISGQVFDAKTKEILPFASIVVKNTNNGVYTDEFGRFSLNQRTKDNLLVVSCLGYITQYLKASDAKEIYLIPKINQLNEVVVRFVNPAHKIIQNAIANKAQNDPENWPFFQYKVYHKSIISADIDSLNINKKLGETLKNNDLYVNESVGLRKYLQPKLSKEVIVGSKTSGTKSTLFSSLTPMLQQFGFYRDFITFQGRGIQEMVNFESPLSAGSIKRYDFNLVDTLVNNDIDSTFIIEFEPNKNSNFEGLRGVIYLNSATYALEYVEAEPANAGSLHFKLVQNYTQIPNSKKWFPTELSAEWLLNDFKIGGQKLRYIINSKISEINIDMPILATEFDENSLIINQDAAYQSESFWQKNRPDSLSLRDKNTYSYQKNLPQGKRFLHNIVLNASEWYTSGMIPLSKKLDLSIQNLFDANIYEGFRPTLNILTNDIFSKFIKIDGKLGYGFTDKALKYEGRVRFTLNEKYKVKLGISYRNDISEPGNIQYFIWNSPQIPYELIRTYQIARADSLSQWKAELNFRPMKHSTVSIALVDEYRNPTYNYKFHNPMHDPRNEMMNRFHNQEVSIGFRYAFGEQFSQVGRGSILTSVPSPTILVNLINGQLCYPEGKVGYTKLNTKLEYNIKTPGFGDTFINVSAGKIWGNVPYPFLYNGRGGKAENGNLIWVANHFNTMCLYEFVGDQYANLFLTHSFRQLLFKPKSNWFQPDVSVFQGIAFGSLSNQMYHEGLTYKTLEKGYFESGLMIDNLYRQKLLKLLHIGAGIGVFNRWGSNKLLNSNENWAYRLVWNVKF
jgi:Family of unknown function (DUF5686)/CarboxypepD_reg-like domain